MKQYDRSYLTMNILIFPAHNIHLKKLEIRPRKDDTIPEICS